MNTIQSSTECLVKDVTDPGSSTQLGGLDVSSSPVHCGYVGAGKLGDDLQQSRVLVDHVLAVRVEKRLELRRHNVDSGFQLWQTVSNVVHQESVEGLGKVWSSVSGCQGGILSLEERRFVLDGIPAIRSL